MNAPAQTAPETWQQALASAYGSAAELLAALRLDPAACGFSATAAAQFPLRVPRGFAARMRPGDPRDPLLRQVLPVHAETDDVAGYTSDPVGDLAALRGPGLIQKYAGRALLVTTGACAVHCRYCFRREFPYQEQAPGPAALRQNLALIAADPSLTEVILSGGDPLLRTDAWLGTTLASLEAIPHVRRTRIHTRLPVVLPQRVDGGLASTLHRARRPVVVVIHCNHPQELDAGVVAACARLRDAGVTLLNQSVLLRGVNDDIAILAELAERLFDAGVLPYYLHQLDAVRGAAHFAVDDATALRIAAGLAARLPGYLAPRLVREVAGAPAKLPLAAPRQT